MKFTCWFISLVAFAALGADLSSAAAVRGLHFAQDEKQASQSPGELARMLAGQAKVLSVPAKGKAKRRLDKKEKHFALPYGESPVVLFKLPDYASPWFEKSHREVHGAGLTCLAGVLEALMESPQALPSVVLRARFLAHLHSQAASRVLLD